MNTRHARLASGCVVAAGVARSTGAAWHGLAAGTRAADRPAATVTTPIAHAIAGGRDSYADVVNVVGARGRHDPRPRARRRMSPTLFQGRTGRTDRTPICCAGSSATGSAATRAASATPRTQRAPRQRGARLRRHRDDRRLHPDQQPRRRRRRRDHGRADRRPHADGEAGRHRQAERSRAAEDRRRPTSIRSRSATPTPCRSATSCSRSATRSASARR